MPITEKELDREVLRLTTTGTYTKMQPRDPWTRSLLMFFDGTGIEWELCTETAGKAEIIKIYDDYLKFLLSIPHGTYQGQETAQFLWMVGPDPDKEGDTISPDDASSYLIRKRFPGTKITHSRDNMGREITDIESKGRRIRAVFPKRRTDDN
jgi:hypothetical protein